MLLAYLVQDEHQGCPTLRTATPTTDPIKSAADTLLSKYYEARNKRRSSASPKDFGLPQTRSPSAGHSLAKVYCPLTLSNRLNLFCPLQVRSHAVKPFACLSRYSPLFMLGGVGLSKGASNLFRSALVLLMALHHPSKSVVRDGSQQSPLCPTSHV